MMSFTETSRNCAGYVILTVAHGGTSVQRIIKVVNMHLRTLERKHNVPYYRIIDRIHELGRMTFILEADVKP